MAQPYVLVSVRSLGEFELRIGSIIGRMPGVALWINDPRLSEAHALVSLRGGRIYLMSLRGALSVASSRVREVELRPGLRVALAPGVEVEVLSVCLPAEVPALRIGDAEPVMLTEPRAWVGDTPVRLHFSDHADPPLRVWSGGETWYATTGGPAEVCTMESHWRVGGTSVRFTRVTTEGSPPTFVDVEEPLTIYAGKNAFRIERAGREPVVFTGLRARILTEVALVNASVSWRDVARRVWAVKYRAEKQIIREARGAVQDTDLQNWFAKASNRWAQELHKIRKQLERGGLDRDLLKSDAGQIVFRRGPRDTLVDET